MNATQMFAIAVATLVSLAGSQAQAQYSPSNYYGNNVTTDDISFGTAYANGPGPMVTEPYTSLAGTQMSIVLSKPALSAFNAIQVEVGRTDPLMVTSTLSTSRPLLTFLSATAPADDILAAGQSITRLELGTPGITTVSTNGKLTISAVADDITNSGGSLTLSNLTFDAAGRHILADVVSDNGLLPFTSQVPIFELSDLKVTAPDVLSKYAGASSSSLRLTSQGLDTFNKGLALIAPGSTAIAYATEFGTVTLNVGTVPEPATWASMVLGMVAMAGVAGRARRRQAH